MSAPSSARNATSNANANVSTPCFWQANGNLVCSTENVHVPNAAPVGKPAYAEFASFGQPNANYKPNAYRQQTQWFDERQAPCCNAPCDCPCEPARESPMSPPRDYAKVHGYA